MTKIPLLARCYNLTSHPPGDSPPYGCLAGLGECAPIEADPTGATMPACPKYRNKHADRLAKLRSRGSGAPLPATGKKFDRQRAEATCELLGDETGQAEDCIICGDQKGKKIPLRVCNGPHKVCTKDKRLAYKQDGRTVEVAWCMTCKDKVIAGDSPKASVEALSDASPAPRGVAIPKIFHRVWLGKQPLPAEFVAYGETWLKLHPGWEMFTWTESNLAPLSVANCKAWAQAASFSQQSDVIRHLAVLAYGGVYIDTDFECLKNIDPLLAGQSCVVGREDDKFIGSAFIAAVPGHPVLQKIVAELNKGIDPRAPHTCIGPSLVTRCVAGSDAKVHPPEVLYPYHWSERSRKGETFPDAFAAHHWNQSWKVS